MAEVVRPVDVPQNAVVIERHGNHLLRMAGDQAPGPILALQLHQLRPEAPAEQHRVAALTLSVSHDDMFSVGLRSQLPQGGGRNPRHISKQHRHRSGLRVCQALDAGSQA